MSLTGKAPSVSSHESCAQAAASSDTTSLQTAALRPSTSPTAHHTISSTPTSCVTGSVGSSPASRPRGRRQPSGRRRERSGAPVGHARHRCAGSGSAEIRRTGRTWVSGTPPIAPRSGRRRASPNAGLRTPPGARARPRTAFASGELRSSCTAFARPSTSQVVRQLVRRRHGRSLTPLRLPWSAACDRALEPTSSGTQPEGHPSTHRNAVTRENAFDTADRRWTRRPLRQRRRPSPNRRRGPLTWANARVGGGGRI